MPVGYRLSEQEARQLVRLARSGEGEQVVQLLDTIHENNTADKTDSFCRRLLVARLTELMIEVGLRRWPEF